MCFIVSNLWRLKQALIEVNLKSPQLCIFLFMKFTKYNTLFVKLRSCETFLSIQILKNFLLVVIRFLRYLLSLLRHFEVYYFKITLPSTLLKSNLQDHCLTCTLYSFHKSSRGKWDTIQGKKLTVNIEVSTDKGASVALERTTLPVPTQYMLCRDLESKLVSAIRTKQSIVKLIVIRIDYDAYMVG